MFFLHFLPFGFNFGIFGLWLPFGDTKVLMITQQIPSLDPALPMVDQLDTLSLVKKSHFLNIFGREKG